MVWSVGPLALALLLPARASAEFSCPVFEPAAVSEGDARYASKPVVDCAFKFIGGKAAGANSCRLPHITARQLFLAHPAAPAAPPHAPAACAVQASQPRDDGIGPCCPLGPPTHWLTK